MCPFVPALGLEYPLELVAYDQALLDNNFLNLDAIFLPNFLESQAQDDSNDHVKIKQRKSPQSTSSPDHHQFGAPTTTTTTTTTTKKTNHNASERDRRKKINVLYSSLRDLLPATDQMKRLSIPATVARVLKYIPELQEEVKDLTQRKEDLLSEVSMLQGNNQKDYIHEENSNICKNKEKLSSSFSISINNLREKELVIQISTLFERVSLCEVIMLLEKNHHIIIDVSSFQSFGGRFFYNLHLLLEENYVVNYEKLNEELLYLFQNQKQQFYTYCS